MYVNISILLRTAMNKNILNHPIKNITELLDNSETIIDEILINSEVKTSINIKQSFNKINNIEDNTNKINITELLRQQMIKNN